MDRLPFFIVDVFAEAKYAGNQLAVFRGAGGLAQAEMLTLAREMNFSETTFVSSETPRDGGYDVRIFTPNEEVPFAGHPTLGTAHILRTRIAVRPVDKIVLNLKVGQIPVTFDAAGPGGGLYWMRQNAPEFGRELPREALAAVLSLEPAEIDERFPIEEVSTGLPFIIVPLKTLASLKQARVAREKYFELVQDGWAKGVLIFCPEGHTPQNQVSVRVFVDYFGVPEDPATGSGNGCLAGYMVAHRYWGQPSVDVRVEQGYEIGRPSLLFLKAQEVDGGIQVLVGGHAITVAEGEFLG
jgi:trans-2,3-dihydro-3-hydroxyanthranilate isomerase